MIEIYYTKFTNLNDDGTEKSHYYGYRIFDPETEEAEYDATLDNLITLKKRVNQRNLLVYIKQTYPTFYKKIVQSRTYAFNNMIYNV
ncbi:hypothetical protein [Haloplasma contractile]|uniref:Uncharacterized protein n=1 Tax=Haloplasma contractile SSD-17B TaxID=1033810 RepID=U2E8H8_9MOLU|nr:hypothetical protein [Haloplasma contractile]ERJ11473.1 hypothetical protein HLPCO_002385 [Haloplasma contractile SSD-17B]